MGMFDYLTCKMPLPIEGFADRQFQTKDTPNQYCDEYEIRADGTLWVKEYDTEDRSDPNAEGLMRLCGSATRVNERWVPCNFSDSINFYDSVDWRYDQQHEWNVGWIEFQALIDNGNVLWIKTVSHEPAGPRKS